jgi:UDP-glucuronate 4-epimerase
MNKFLITGAAGFIGFHLSKRLIAEGHSVVGLDNLNAYYDPKLKQARLAQLRDLPKFSFQQIDLADQRPMAELFAQEKFDCVVNLAAQAGVRYSLENPRAYIDSNIVGFLNVLEGCRHNSVKHLVYASSSSVYGANKKVPFSVSDNVNYPVSLYAASKKSNELMAFTYSHLFNIPTTGLRFFTVYGPWGRPDMALYLFTKAIFEDRPIDIFNQGNMQRDFTYIDDIVDGIIRSAKLVPQMGQFENAKAPYRLYNIGNNQPVELMRFIEVLEKTIGKKAKRNLLPMQPGDVQATFADIADLTRDTGFKPTTSIDAGIPKFIEWFRSYHRS